MNVPVPQPVLPGNPNSPTDVVIDWFEAARISSDEFYPSIGEYGFGYSQKYHTIKSSELDMHIGEILEIVVTNFHDPDTIKFSHSYKPFKKTPRPSKLIRGNRWAWLRTSTDIEATIHGFGENTRFLFRFLVSRFANNPHLGQYIAAGRGVSGDLFLAIFPYDRIGTHDLPVTNPDFGSMQVGQNIYYGPTPSCGVKIPGGRP